MDDVSRSYRIVVGVGFTDACKQAVVQALQLAAHVPGAELHFTTVLENTHFGRASELAGGPAQLTQAESQLVDFVHDAARQARVEPTTSTLVFHVRLGDAADALTQIAFDVDASLIVVGCRPGRRIAKMFAGSVSGKLHREGRYPVLVARTPRVDGMIRTARPDPPRPGQDLTSNREDVLQEAQRVDFGRTRPRISGLF